MTKYFMAKKKGMKAIAAILSTAVIAATVFAPAVSADREYIVNEEFDSLENLDSIAPQIKDSASGEVSTDENYTITLEESPTGIGKAMKLRTIAKIANDKKTFEVPFVFNEQTFSTSNFYILSLDFMDTETSNLKHLFTHNFALQRGDAESKKIAYYSIVNAVDDQNFKFRNFTDKYTLAPNALVGKPHKIAFVVSGGDVYRTIVDGAITLSGDARFYMPRPANNTTFSQIGIRQFSYGSPGTSWYDNVKMYKVSGFEVLDTVFKIDGAPAARTAAGEATATITTFNTLAEEQNYILILASYEGDKLLNVTYKPVTVPAVASGHNIGSFSTDGLTVTNPAATLKAFLWKGGDLTGMDPVKKAEVLLGQGM